jgi:hypothetical protein
MLPAMQRRSLDNLLASFGWVGLWGEAGRGGWRSELARVGLLGPGAARQGRSCAGP